MRLRFLLLCICLSAFLHAQSSITDSLKEVVRNSKVDTCVIDALNELASSYRKQSQMDSAIVHARDALSRSLRIGYLRGEGNARYQLGVIYGVRGEAVSAMRYLDSAAVLFERIGDRKMLASSLQAYGLQKSTLGDYPVALTYCLRALSIKRELGDSSTLGSTYNNIGHIYRQNEDFAKALIAYRNGVRIDSTAGNFRLVATGYYNIGNATVNMHGDTALAQKYLYASIRISDSLGDELNSAYATSLLAQLMVARHELEQAEVLHRQVLAVAEKAGDTRLLVSTYLLLGEAQARLGKRAEALENLKRGEQLSDEYQLKDVHVMSLKALSEFFAEGNEPGMALEYLRRYISENDSLINAEKNKEMTRHELNYEFEKQRELDRAEQAKNEAVFEEDKRRKMFIIYSGAAFLVLVLLFLAFVYSRYRVSQKQKALIAEQKLEVEAQSMVIEEKNKDITDSINYAKRIQSAILPQPDDLLAVFPEAFLLFRPKDIVSGDFYWFASTEEYFFYVTADCTGHGVPGGFMSMLGTALLNEIVMEKKIVEPGRIMDAMRDRIITSLRQKGSTGENKDGMDMVLCRINKNRTELCFSAANNNLWLVRRNELIEYKADKQPVGIGPAEPVPFTQHLVALQKGDIIYTYTDGFADQFGGPKGKKYKYSQLKSLLLSMAGKSMEEQGRWMNSEFITWKDNLDQVDDVLVIGIKMS